MSAALAGWVVDGAGNKACTILAHTVSCFPAELTGALLGGALFAGIALLALLLPARLVAGLCATLVPIVLASGAGAALALRGRLEYAPVTAGKIAVAATLVALLAASLSQLFTRARRASYRGFGVALVRRPYWLLLLVALAALTILYVSSSSRILFWDSLNYWQKTDYAANLLRRNFGPRALAELLGTATDEYSMIPAILPGVLNLGEPQRFLLGYMAAVAVCYVFPAAIAIGGLGVLLSRGFPAHRTRQPSTAGAIVLGGVAGFALLPMFLQTFLKSVYLDVGGVPVIVLLLCAWYHCIETVLRPTRPPRALELLGAGVCLALLSILAFIFRRWYVFDVLGFGIAAVAYTTAAFLFATRPRTAILRDLGIVAAGALLAGVTAGAPVIVNWVSHWQRRQYAESYASYWPGWPDELERAYDSFGLAVPLACTLLLLALALFGRARSLAVVLLLGTALGAVGFFRIEGMGFQHYYLFMPMLGGAAAAGAILIARRVGMAAAALLVAAAFAVLAGVPRQDNAFAFVRPRGVDLYPVRDPAVPELIRMAHWLNDNLRPGEHYCVLASSFQFNASLASEVWQTAPALLGTPAQNDVIWLNEVDSWMGPPDAKIRECAIMIAASPPQTHLRPAEQQSILLPLHDVLTGTGIGAAFARTPETFALANGLILSTFKLVRPVSDAELAELRRRFFETKGADAERYRARFGKPELDGVVK